MNTLLSTGTHLDEITLVYNTLLQGILRRATRRDHERLNRLRRYLLNGLEDTQLSNDNHAKMRSWTRQLQLSEHEHLPPNLASEERIEFLNLLYISICAEMGPVAADRIFAEAAKETDTLPEAARFPTRNFF